MTGFFHSACAHTAHPCHSVCQHFLPSCVCTTFSGGEGPRFYLSVQEWSVRFTGIMKGDYFSGNLSGYTVPFCGPNFSVLWRQKSGHLPAHSWVLQTQCL